MPIRSTRVAVTAAAPKSLLPVADGAGSRFDQSVVVKNPASSTAAVFVGGDDVTAATGLELSPGESLNLDVAQPDAPFAITASGSVTLHVMQVGV